MNAPSRASRTARAALLALVRRSRTAAIGVAGGVHQLSSQRAAATRLDRIGAQGGAVVVGPWVSEVGFELLYWIPFVRWVLERRSIAPERVTVLTRGGAHCWYLGLAERHVEILDLMPPAEFRGCNEQRALSQGGLKQTLLSDMDAEILRRADDALEPDAELLHPEAMHALFRYFWTGRSSAAAVARRTRFAPIGPVRHTATAGLPERYVAIKAYHSAALPDTNGNRRFVADLVRGLCAQTTVVELSTETSVDEHAAVTLPDGCNVVRMDERFSARDNLEAQTAVVAGADALVSTYGGFSYLGSFVGVPSMALASVRNDNPRHLDMARAAARQLGTAPPAVHETGSAHALDDIVGGMRPQAAA